MIHDSVVKMLFYFILYFNVLTCSSLNAEDAMIAYSRQRLIQADIKVRYFRTRLSYYANTDATRTGGRFNQSLLLVLAGDVELNPGPMPSSRQCVAAVKIGRKSTGMFCKRPISPSSGWNAKKKRFDHLRGLYIYIYIFCNS